MKCLSSLGIFHTSTVIIKIVGMSKCLDISPEFDAHREEFLASSLLVNTPELMQLLMSLLDDGVPKSIQDATMNLILNLPVDKSLLEQLYISVVEKQESLNSVFESPRGFWHYTIIAICCLLRPSAELIHEDAHKLFSKQFWHAFDVDLLIFLLVQASVIDRESSTLRYEATISALHALLAISQDLINRALHFLEQPRDSPAISSAFLGNKCSTAVELNDSDKRGERLSQTSCNWPDFFPCKKQEEFMYTLFNLFKSVCDPTGLGACIGNDNAKLNYPLALELIHLFKQLRLVNNTLDRDFLRIWSEPENLQLLVLQCPFQQARAMMVDALCDAFTRIGDSQPSLWRTTCLLLEDCQWSQSLGSCDDFFTLISRLSLLLNISCAHDDRANLLSQQIHWLEVLIIIHVHFNSLTHYKRSFIFVYNRVSAFVGSHFVHELRIRKTFKVFSLVDCASSMHSYLDLKLFQPKWFVRQFLCHVVISTNFPYTSSFVFIRIFISIIFV